MSEPILYFDFEKAKESGITPRQNIDYLRNKSTNIDWTEIENNVANAKLENPELDEDSYTLDLLKSTNPQIYNKEETPLYDTSKSGTFDSFSNFASDVKTEALGLIGLDNIAQSEEQKQRYKELDFNIREKSIRGEKLNSAELDRAKQLHGSIFSLEAIKSIGDEERQRKNIANYYKARDSALSKEKYADLSRAEKEAMNYDEYLLGQAWDYITGKSMDERFKEWKDSIKAQDLSPDIARSLTHLQNISPYKDIFSLIGQENEKEATKYLKDVENIALLAGFDGIGYDKKKDIYFYKDGTYYKPHQGFLENFSDVMLSNAFSLGGAIAGGTKGFSSGKTPQQAVIKSILGAAVGSGVGGALDYQISNVYLNRDANFSEMLRHATQEGVLSVVGDVAVLGVAQGIKRLPKPSLDGIKDKAKTIIEYTPFVGFASRAMDGNKASALKLINKTFSDEQIADLRKFGDAFGGELTLGSPANARAFLSERFGEDSAITRYGTKIYESLSLNNQALAQKDFIHAIRADESGNLIAFISEVANSSPIAQDNLKKLLNKTTFNLQKNLKDLNLAQNEIKDIFTELEQGTKDSYKEAMESVLTKIYDNYKVNLNDLKAGNSNLLDSKIQKDLSPQEIKEAVDKWDLSNPNAKDKILISKINEAEAKQLQKEFNFKGNYPLAREIDASHIAHALKNHGDEATELARGQIAISKDEIFSNYPSITKTYDERILTEQNTIIYAKKINGHFIAIEEALTGQNKLRFKTAWKTRGELNKEVLLKNAKATPKASKPIESYSLEEANAVRSLDRTLSGDTLNNTLALNANSSKTFANFKEELQEAGIPTDLSNSFLSFLEKNIYSKEGVNFSQLNNALKVLNSYYKEAKDPNFKDHIKRAMETFIRDDIKQGIDAIFAQNKTLYKDAQNLFSSALNDYAVMKNTIKVIDKLKLRDESIAYNKAFDNLHKYLKGQGGDLSNLDKLTKALDKESTERVELNLLQDLFNKSLFESKELKVFNSKDFLERISHLQFKSKGAKEFIDIAKGFDKLFKNDALIAQSITNTTTQKIGSSIATTLSGAIKFQVIKSMFSHLVRLMPHIPFAKGLNEKVQGSALRYHVQQALSKSLDITDFTKTLSQRAKKGNFTNETRNILNNISDKVAKAQDELIAEIQEREAKALALREQELQDQAKRSQKLENDYKAKEANLGKSATDIDLVFNDEIAFKPLKESYVNIRDDIDGLKVHYAVVNTNDIKPNFERGQTQGRVLKQYHVIDSIVKDFNPRKLFYMDGGSDGLPIIARDGQVIAGNHRAEAISKLNELNPQARAEYERVAKELYNVDLKPNEVIVRVADSSLDDKDISFLAFSSNLGRENTMGEKALSLHATFKENIAKLPRHIPSENVQELSQMVSKALDKQSQMPNIDDTNLALLVNLARNARESDIVKSLDSIKGSADQAQKIRDLFVLNAGSFHNLVNFLEFKSLDIRDYLSEAIYHTAHAIQRSEDFALITNEIKAFNALTDEGKKATLTLDNHKLHNLTSQALGYALAKFSRQENPADALYQVMKVAPQELIDRTASTLFSEGKAWSEIDIYDFIAYLVSQGQQTHATSELLDTLPLLRELSQKYGDTGLQATPAISKVETHTPQEIKKIIDEWDLSPQANKAQKQRAVISQVDEAEAKQLEKEFNFKGKKQLVREIDSHQVIHALKNHGDEATELARGQIAITKDDISRYQDITKEYDLREVQDNGKILYAKQVNGHYVVLEEALEGQDKIRFFDIWKVKGNLNKEVLLTHSQRPNTTPSLNLDSPMPSSDKIKGSAETSYHDTFTSKEPLDNQEAILPKNDTTLQGTGINQQKEIDQVLRNEAQEIDKAEIRDKELYSQTSQELISKAREQIGDGTHAHNFKGVIDSEIENDLSNIKQHIKNQKNLINKISNRIPKIEALKQINIHHNTADPQHFKTAGLKERDAHLSHKKLDEIMDEIDEMFSLLHKKSEQITEYLKGKNFFLNNDELSKLIHTLEKSNFNTYFTREDLYHTDLQNILNKYKLLNQRYTQALKSYNDLKDLKPKNPQEIKESQATNRQDLRLDLQNSLSTLIGKEIINNNDGRIAILSSKNIKKMGSDKAIQKSLDNGFSIQEHFQASKDIENLYKDAVFKETTQDTKGDNANLLIHRYIKQIDSDKSALITLKESLDKDTTRIYTLELEALAKPNAIEGGNSNLATSIKATATSPNSNGTLTNTILPQNLENFNKYFNAEQKEIFNTLIPKNNTRVWKTLEYYADDLKDLFMPKYSNKINVEEVLKDYKDDYRQKTLLTYLENKPFETIEKTLNNIRDFSKDVKDLSQEGKHNYKESLKKAKQQLDNLLEFFNIDLNNPYNLSTPPKLPKQERLLTDELQQEMTDKAKPYANKRNEITAEITKLEKAKKTKANKVKIQRLEGELQVIRAKIEGIQDEYLQKVNSNHTREALLLNEDRWDKFIEKQLHPDLDKENPRSLENEMLLKRAYISKDFNGNTQKHDHYPTNEAYMYFNRFPNVLLLSFIRENHTKSENFFKHLARGKPDSDLFNIEGFAFRKDIEDFYLITPNQEYGINYAEFYQDGQGAINKLINEAKDYEIRKASDNLSEAEKAQGQYKGQVAQAFYRKDLEEISGTGRIDLVWGEITNKEKNEGYGLVHIMDKHPDFDLNLMPKIIDEGKLVENAGVYTFIYKNQGQEFRVGLSQGYKGQGDNYWIITAYERKQPLTQNFDQVVTKAENGNNLSQMANESIPKIFNQGEVSFNTMRDFEGWSKFLGISFRDEAQKEEAFKYIQAHLKDLEC